MGWPPSFALAHKGGPPLHRRPQARHRSRYCACHQHCAVGIRVFRLGDRRRAGEEKGGPVLLHVKEEERGRPREGRGEGLFRASEERRERRREKFPRRHPTRPFAFFSVMLTPSRTPRAPG